MKGANRGCDVQEFAVEQPKHRPEFLRRCFLVCFLTCVSTGITRGSLGVLGTWLNRTPRIINLVEPRELETQLGTAFQVQLESAIE